MKKIILSLFLSLLVPLSVMAFSDVSTDHLYNDAINWGIEEQIVTGYSDGTFKPDQKVNRAEFLKMLFEFQEQEILSYEIEFKDVEKGDWYYPYIETAVKKGLVKGYEDGTFRPDKNISFVEFAKIFVENLGFKMKYSYYKEVWYLRYVDILAKAGLILPTIEGFDYELTRAEILEIFYREANALEKDSQDYLSLYLNSGEEIEIIENPVMSKYVELLNYVEVLRKGLSFDEYPLPWNYIKSIDGESFVLVDANGDSLHGLLSFTRLAKDSLFYVSRLYVDSSVQSFLDHDASIFEDYEESEYDAGVMANKSYAYIPVKITLNGDWLVIPYVTRQVGAINLRTGKFVLETLPRFYSNVVFNGEKFVYFEHNEEGCVNNRLLIRNEKRAFKKDATCYLWTYDVSTQEEKVSDMESTFGMSMSEVFLKNQIKYVDDNFIWINEYEYAGCPVGTKKYVKKYDLDTLKFVGEKAHYFDDEYNKHVQFYDKDGGLTVFIEDNVGNLENKEWLEFIDKYSEFIDFLPEEKDTEALIKGL